MAINEDPSGKLLASYNKISIISSNDFYYD